MSESQTPSTPGDADLVSIWQRQPLCSDPLKLGRVTGEVKRFSARIAVRNATEWIACAVIGLTFGRLLLTFEAPPAVRIGSLGPVFAAVYVAARLYRDGRNRPLPDPAADTLSFARAYRSELLRQAALLEDVRSWYLGPLAFGVLAFLVGVVWSVPGPARLVVVPVLALVGLTFYGVERLNRRAARKARERAERLSGDWEEAWS